ncbi:MAG: cytochrome ubiquinol oxidase subunit I [Candidatus Kapabacteria bacterium]|jgi:cytochrome d ubiquinol oxidase subunit I|nr:cytochrome ubiquinol oxidase subunit I [Candidatus Kapabacteria bacterium]
MDVEILARIQFALTTGFHFIFPPLSIGLSVLLVIMKWKALKEKDGFYDKMADFWLKIFALTFSVGVATGIVLEFEFGTNWATYSRYVGDIFGSPLAAEGLFAFFLESTFLGVLLFGKNRVSKRTHFIAALMVTIGATMSAFWIIVANSWMQTPAGFQIVGEGLNARAEIVDFWAMVWNPSTIDRFTHVIGGSWLTGAFFGLSLSAYYLVKNQHVEFAKSSFRISLALAVLASLFQLGTGHASAIGVSQNQPVKLAAFEGQFETGPGDLYLFGWVDAEDKETKGIAIPGMLSYMVAFDTQHELIGLNDVPEDLQPPLQITFQSYHLMVAVGMTMIGMALLALFLLWRKKLFTSKLVLMLFIPSFILPQIGNLTGWTAAEVGRQPWVVHNVLRTSDALSKVVSADQIVFSIILFSVIYTILMALFIFLMSKKIKAGPEPVITEG